MNKKQLFIIWIIVLILCYLLLTAPTLYLGYVAQGIDGAHLQWFDEPHVGRKTEIQWDFVLQYGLVVLLMGAVLAYTVRDKK